MLLSNNSSYLLDLGFPLEGDPGSSRPVFGLVRLRERESEVARVALTDGLQLRVSHLRREKRDEN